MHWQITGMGLTNCGYQSTWEQASGGMPFPKNRLIVSFTYAACRIPESMLIGLVALQDAC